MKCRYLDEITGGRGTCFATGTPISNSMVEMYTMQKYLQYNTLKERDLIHFDAWASNYGETITAIELAPEGTGYRAKTRFAKFYNLPELIMMFKEVADIQTADMLNLPVPKANYHNIVLKPSEHQKEFVASLSERAEKVRNKMVDNVLNAFEEKQIHCREQLERERGELENAKTEVQKPFPKEEEYRAKVKRLDELNILLNMDKKENEIVDGERGDENEENTPERTGEAR